jgi:ribosomal protein S15P/S13E
VEIDMLRVSGEDLGNVDNRIVALNLVKRGITDATMFDLCGTVLQPQAALYKKNILLMRGRFRPATKVHMDMIECGYERFVQEDGVSEENVAVIFELTLKDLTADGKISDKDFIDRANLLSAMGYTVMISNYLKHYKMLEYLSAIARGHKMGVIAGIYNLHTIFDEKYYDNLSGGLLEAFGRGFGHNVKMYVYPANNVENGNLYELDNIQLPVHLMGLIQYLKATNKLEAIRNFDRNLLHILSDDVLAKINAHSHSWEDDVPDNIAKAIKFYELFGYSNRLETVTY